MSIAEKAVNGFKGDIVALEFFIHRNNGVYMDIGVGGNRWVFPDDSILIIDEKGILTFINAVDKFEEPIQETKKEEKVEKKKSLMDNVKEKKTFLLAGLGCLAFGGAAFAAKSYFNK